MPLVARDQVDRKFHGESTTRAVTPRDLDAPPQHPTVAGASEAIHALLVGPDQLGGNDELRQRPTHRLLGRPSEQHLCLTVPQRHLALLVDADHGVQRGVHHRVEQTAAVAHHGFGLTLGLATSVHPGHQSMQVERQPHQPGKFLEKPDVHA